MALTWEQIQKAEDLPREEVQVPEWGGSVFVRGLSASEKDSLDDENYKLKGKDFVLNRQHLKARLLARTLCDESGNPIVKANDIAALGKKSTVVLERLFAVAQRLSGMGKEAEEELAGNADGGPADSS